MTQIRNSHGQIIANVTPYQGTHRSGTESHAAPFLPYAGRHSGLPGRHGARCECRPGYVCLTHKIAR